MCLTEGSVCLARQLKSDYFIRALVNTEIKQQPCVAV